MRKHLLLFLVAAALVATGASVATAQQAVPRTTCSAPTGVKYVDGDFVPIGGKCVQMVKSHRKTVRATYHYSYSYADSNGVNCGKRVDTRAKFTIDPAPPTVRTRFGVSPPGSPGRISWGRWSVFHPGNGPWYCGKLDESQLPSADTLCEWPGPPPLGVYPPNFNNCGEGNSVASFVDVPTKANTWVTAGRIATSSGACLTTTGALNGGDPPPSTTWLGFQLQAQQMRCLDGTVLHVSTVLVGLTNLAGTTCYGRPSVGGLWGFQVPPAWGGTLRVLFALAGGRAGQQIYETETAVFTLSGSADGCPTLDPGHS